MGADLHEALPLQPDLASSRRFGTRWLLQPVLKPPLAAVETRFFFVFSVDYYFDMAFPSFSSNVAARCSQI
ncbi:UNVERIFIED_CONTAM: hypothetical protein Slati_3768000 [Sesamum latifolium]|uniref:Uncharacterized protein n=1 Tax=Sesamum latifolium TaxID=2727402 RepID=A0AAW2U5G1_9LAMI